MRRTAILVALTPFLAAAGTVPAGIDLRQIDPRTVAECDALVLAHPESHEAYRCYLLVARRSQRWSEAVRSLDARLAVDPDDHLARLFLGWIEADRFRPRASDLLRSAAEGLSRTGDPTGEVYARLERAKLLLQQGRFEESSDETELAEQAASRAEDAELVALAKLQRGWLAFRRSDYTAAEALFGALGAENVPHGPERLQAGILGGMAAVAWATGRLDEAFDLYRRAAEQCRRVGDRYQESTELYNMALIAGRLAVSGKKPRDEVRRLTRAAVEASRAGGNLSAEASARLHLAQEPDLSHEDRIAETERALDILRRTGLSSTRCFATRLLANQLVAQDASRNRPRAEGLLDEAMELARFMGSLPDLARTHIVRAEIARAAVDPAATVQAYLDAVETIEKIRDLQRDELVRARSLWDWAFVYHRAAGYLLESNDRNPSPRQVALAFEIVERLRARIVLDVMDSARATERVVAGGEDYRRREGLLERIAAVQRELLAAGANEPEASDLLVELDRLEAREAELRDRIARSEPSFALLRRPVIAGIDDIQRALAPDQALVAFHLSTREISDRKWYWNGGSWAFLITKDDYRITALPDRDVVDEKVAVFLGVIRRRDDLEPEAAAGLYRVVLGELLAESPETIERLLVIPDGALHQLPFGALRPDPASEPLAMRYEIGTVPSASLWLHWKRARTRPRTGPVLALADPQLPVPSESPDSERSALLSADRGLGPLPHARMEARKLARELGGGRLVIGGNASEHYVKTADLEPFGVLHFAAHAVIDDHRPQRSGIVLAPGAPEEDGLLQMREVVALDLRDALVILSACSSASGETTGSEGVVGLARAFFQAGARAVVATLWPVQDDEAAAFVEDLGRELGRGSSVGAAVSAARRRRIRSGAPTAAWAGMVVLGDPDFGPVAGAPSARRWFRPGVIALLVLALVASLIRLRRRLASGGA